MSARVPYFDRPRPPRDWRWWVGGFGRCLISTGVLMFGFVAYQLWGTGIQTARAQGELRKQLESVIPTLPGQNDPTDSVQTPTIDPNTLVPTTIPRAASTPAVPNGTPLGYIIIPKIELNWAFLEGVREQDIEDGPGHFKETPMPGQIGNVAIAGHRTTHGQPFYSLDKLKPGDEILFVTDAGRYTYAVTESFVVAPSEYNRVVPAFKPDTATVTLVTCTPLYTAQSRLIVRGEIVEAKSGQLYLPPLPDGTTSPDTTGTLPGEEVDTTPTAPPSDTSSDTSTGTSTGTSTPGTAPSDTTSTVPEDGLASEGGSGADSAFEGGWFDDTDAVPQIALWGLVLAAIAFVSYRIGRRARHLLVAFLVGAAPFTVALYFWYENINRLLPPGL